MSDLTFLQWPFFEQAHSQTSQSLHLWIKEYLTPVISKEHLAGSDHDQLDTVCRKMVSLMGQAGWLKHCVPKHYGDESGGPDSSMMDVRSLCVIRETLAYYSGLADFCFAMQGLGSGSISLYGSHALKQRYLPAIASGEKIAAFALSEPNGGSDPALMETSAVLNGDEYILNGEKTWISNAGLADQYVVFVRTNEQPGAKGISAMVVDANTPGLSVTKRISIISPHPLGALKFSDCRVSKSNLIGVSGEGLKIALATLDVFRTTVGAAALGFARRALDEAMSWCESRTIGDESLLDKQLPQAHVAQAAMHIDAASLLIYRAAWTKDVTKVRISKESSMAKLYATEEAQKVIDIAVQLHGGQGVVSGEPVERLYREIRALRIYEGPSDIHKLIIASQLRKQRLKEPKIVNSIA